MTSAPERILVIRPDRIGDVILSTPVFGALRASFPRARITVLVRSLVEPVLRNLDTIDDLLIFEPDGRHAGPGGFRALVKELRAGRFDAAVALQSHRRIAAAAAVAGIPVRIGPRSKAHSYLFYNRGIRQKRSAVEKHEADYNLELLRPLGIGAEPREFPTRIGISEAAQLAADRWLSEQGIRVSGFVAIHPGMGGSALNWPEENYAALARRLLARGSDVVITGGPGEDGLLSRFRNALNADATPSGGAAAPVAEGSSAGSSGRSRATFFGGADGPGIDVLSGIFRRAGVVVAPSTGPLHLAVAAGAPVVTFYPPIRVQSAKRWGPYVQDPSRASVLVPEAHCKAAFSCLGPGCPDFPCMERLTVERALEEVLKSLPGGSEDGS